MSRIIKCYAEVNSLKEKVENTDFNAGTFSSREAELGLKEISNLVKISYNPKSMRNNPVYSDIKEAPLGSIGDCIKDIKHFLVKKKKIANDIVSDMKFQ